MSENDNAGNNIDNQKTIKIGWHCYWQSMLLLIPAGFILSFALEYIAGAVLLLILMKAPDFVARFVGHSDELAMLLNDLSYWKVMEQIFGGIFDKITDINMFIAYFLTGTIVFHWFGKRTIRKFFFFSPGKYVCIWLFTLLLAAVTAVYLLVGLPFGYIITLLNPGVWVVVPWLIFIAVFSIYTTGYIIKWIVKKTIRNNITLEQNYSGQLPINDPEEQKNTDEETQE